MPLQFNNQDPLSNMESSQLNPFMSLTDSGELRVKPSVLMNITQELCDFTNCPTIYGAYNRIKKGSRTRIKMRSTFNPEVFSVPKSVVKRWTRSMSLVSVPGLYSDLDLEKGKYEGGFKVWESTIDLIKYVTEDQVLMKDLLHRNSKFKVLELGAGASLPTLALLNRIIEDPVFNREYRIHVQDYNWQVLASLTLINFATNLPIEFFQALLETKCLRLFYGDWNDFRSQSNYKYDLIMMSEVIYNALNYESLHKLINRHLKCDGYAIIATKDTYFGLSGSLYSWCDYLQSQNVFNVFKIVKVSTTNIPRSILIMKKKLTD